MELKINRVQYDVTDPDELRLLLAQVRRIQFSEVWLQHTDGWPAMGALINGEAAWLAYVRHVGDAGFSTRYPQFVWSLKLMIENYLTNCHLCEYPSACELS